MDQHQPIGAGGNLTRRVEIGLPGHLVFAAGQRSENGHGQNRLGKPMNCSHRIGPCQRV